MAGDTDSNILKAFPFISAEDVKAFEDFALKMSSLQYSVVDFENAK